MIAALYVQTNGCYFGLPNVDPWDIRRDARLYAGPWPVVAHPPCARWSYQWHACRPIGSPGRREKGDDDGCFAAALSAVRKYGGVLEHPRGSSAFWWHGLNSPPPSGAWIAADFYGGFTCCVEQGNYGHRAPKATWLYAVGAKLPSLQWGPSGALDVVGRSRRRKEKMEIPKSHRSRTPLAFRDLLISIAESATVEKAA